MYKEKFLSFQSHDGSFLFPSPAADDKVEDSQMKQLPPEASIHFPSFHEEPPEEVDPDLDVNSMVEVRPSDKTHYGVIRWIGVPEGSRNNQKIAGVELVGAETVFPYFLVHSHFNKPLHVMFHN